MVASALQRKTLVLTLVKQRRKDCLSLHHKHDNRHLFINRKKIYSQKLKADNNNVNFPSQFCLESISEKFNRNESSELSFKEFFDDFSVDYNAIDISEILNIHKCLMVKKSKIRFRFIKQIFIVIKKYCIIKNVYLNQPLLDILL